jgi:sec-independent protein translocase protein TatB
MMPGIGFEEMVMLVLVAIIVIGPKDLPLMMRKFGRFTGKMRAMAFEFKQGIDELGRQAELDELRKEVQALKSSTGLEDIKREFEQDRIALESDVKSAIAEPTPAPVPTAVAVSGVTGATHPAAPKPLPYAGLSADHPGYDAGEDFRIDGAPPAPAVAAGEAAPEPKAADAVETAEVRESDEVNGVHVIPDDEVRPAPGAPKPAKQDASA